MFHCRGRQARQYWWKCLCVCWSTVKYSAHLDCFISCATNYKNSLVLGWIEKSKMNMRTWVPCYSSPLSKLKAWCSLVTVGSTTRTQTILILFFLFFRESKLQKDNIDIVSEDFLWYCLELKLYLYFLSFFLFFFSFFYQSTERSLRFPKVWTHLTTVRE